MASAAEQLAANINFGAFRKATELHKRLLFTLGAMIVYRLGTYIPIPGIDPVTIANIINRQQGLLGMANLFSGGATLPPEGGREAESGGSPGADSEGEGIR